MNEPGDSGRTEFDEPPTRWSKVRLHIVSGKGGAGKTTVAAALAIGLANRGRRVLLVEVEERQGVAQVLDVPPLSYEERHLVTAPGGGEVMGLAIDPHDALMEYLATYYMMRRAGKTLERIGAVDFATTVAPGLRDVLLTGKIFEAVRRRSKNKPVYDAVVVDAPPTGRITRFLGVSRDVAGLAKVGPIRNHAQSITTLLRSPRTAVHLVTLLEEMSAQETIDTIAELWRARLPVGGIVINSTRRPTMRHREIAALRGGELELESVAKELASVGVDDTETAQLLLDEGADFIGRLGLERRARRMLLRLDRPTFELRMVEGGVDVAAIFELAADLEQQGAI